MKLGEQKLLLSLAHSLVLVLELKLFHLLGNMMKDQEMPLLSLLQNLLRINLHMVMPSPGTGSLPAFYGYGRSIRSTSYGGTPRKLLLSLPLPPVELELG